MKIIILAAGMGTRLGKPFPKPLTPLKNGETIIGRQIRIFSEYVSPDDMYIVVGFKKDMIMEAYPEPCFVYNPYFGDTNTSKSLLQALRKVSGNDVLWINGDVVFESEIIKRVFAEISEGIPFSVVNTSKVGEEEVKYRTDEYGNITEISKQVLNAEGESVGINYITGSRTETFIDLLEAVGDNDYFEKAMDNGARIGSLLFSTLDISDCSCTEVDFPEDLVNANSFLAENNEIKEKDTKP
ncbi:MAG: phosphocholine cytidylyltransferase family protein [Spirochaetales bacterium]|nr:phosphocholine cytidylyltransferase family protein [Spirochaetales bacterium]